MIERIDTWLRAGDITRTSLAGFRIVYATISLLVLPDFSWVADFPDSMYNPPPGPLQLFSGFPPADVLQGLEAAMAVCLVAVLIGWRTRLASFLVVVVAMTGFGFTYSLGKIDHDILLVLVPGAMAWAGWGDRLSVDALRRPGRPIPPERAEQWPLRLFALLVGLAFLTAAVPKVNGGWLSWSSHAVQAMQGRHYVSNGHHGLLAGVFFHVDNPVFWEAMDIATIVLEAGMLLAVLNWRSTRVVFAVAATFHLGVWLMMTIPFVMNVVAYGFVVRWDRVPVPDRVRRQARRAGPVLSRTAPAVVTVGGIGWFLLTEVFGNAVAVVYPAILIGGGLIGGGFLVSLAVRAVHALADPGDAAVGRLIYDSDCGFCTRSARWLAGRRADLGWHSNRHRPHPTSPHWESPTRTSRSGPTGRTREGTSWEAARPSRLHWWLEVVSRWLPADSSAVRSWHPPRRRVTDGSLLTGTRCRAVPMPAGSHSVSDPCRQRGGHQASPGLDDHRAAVGGQPLVARERMARANSAWGAAKPDTTPVRTRILVLVASMRALDSPRVQAGVDRVDPGQLLEVFHHAYPVRSSPRCP